MSFRALVEALQSVPFLATLRITVEEARPGAAVLRLPAIPGNVDHAGGVHTAALFAVGEAAAGVAVGTHPRLVGIKSLQKAGGIKYLSRARTDVRAVAEVREDQLDFVFDEINAGSRAQAEIIVRLLDDEEAQVAEVVSLFTFRR